MWEVFPTTLIDHKIMIGFMELRRTRYQTKLERDLLGSDSFFFLWQKSSGANIDSYR